MSYSAGGKSTPEEQAARAHCDAVTLDFNQYTTAQREHDAFLAGVKWAREQRCKTCGLPPDIHGCDGLCGHPGRDV